MELTHGYTVIRNGSKDGKGEGVVTFVETGIRYRLVSPVLVGFYG